MIIFRSTSGFGTDARNIYYKNIWNIGMLKKSIYFISSNIMISCIVDVKLSQDEKDLELLYYPHNGNNFLSLNSQADREKEMEKQLRNLLKDKVGQCVTVNLFDMSIVTEREFYGVSYGKEPNALYTMCTITGEGGFPKIYVVPEEFFTKVYRNVFPAMIFSSRDVCKPVGEITSLGKKLVYQLYLESVGVEKDDTIPVLSQITFPWNEEYAVPGFYKVDELTKMAENNSKLVKTKSGTKDKESFENSTGGAADIQAMILNKGAISFTTLVDFGVQEVADINPMKNDIITIEQDISGIAKKMCLFEGKLYIIPVDEEFDYGIYTGIPDDLYVLCDEENFPKSMGKAVG
jgi:hypothetical protein